jgi:hypothetical protein
MNHSTRVMRRPRRASPPAARTAAAIIATAALALLAAACSGSPSSTGSGPSRRSAQITERNTEPQGRPTRVQEAGARTVLLLEQAFCRPLTAPGSVTRAVSDGAFMARAG